MAANAPSRSPSHAHAVASNDSTSRRALTMPCCSLRARASDSQRRAVCGCPWCSALRPSWWVSHAILSAGAPLDVAMSYAAVPSAVAAWNCPLSTNPYICIRMCTPSPGIAIWSGSCDCSPYARRACSNAVSGRPTPISAGTSCDGPQGTQARGAGRPRSRALERVERVERVARPAAVGEQQGFVEGQLDLCDAVDRRAGCARRRSPRARRRCRAGPTSGCVCAAR